MSDQAAAEALVAVGRLASSGGAATGEDSDAEAEQPKKKRARRGKAGRSVEKEDEDIVMDGGEESEGREAERKRHVSASNTNNGWTGTRSASPHRAPSRNQDYAAHLQRSAGGAGFELPPLPGLNGAAFLGGAPSSYMRSGSNAPTRTHSPLNPGLGTYVLPPHSGGYFAG